MQVTFKPVFCEKSQWYKMGIFINDKLDCFLHWIESSDGQIVKINSLQFAKPICEKLETAMSMCDQIQEMYKNGEITP